MDRLEDIFHYMQERCASAIEGEIAESEAYAELYDIEKEAKKQREKLNKSMMLSLDINERQHITGGREIITTHKTTYDYSHIDKIADLEKSIKIEKKIALANLSIATESGKEVIDGMMLDDLTGELIPLPAAKVTKYIKVQKQSK